MNERIGFELRHRLSAELVLAPIRGPLPVRGGYAWFPVDGTLSLGQIDTAAHEVLLCWLNNQAGFGPVGVLGSRRAPPSRCSA
jgi:hypothetical protein